MRSRRVVASLIAAFLVLGVVFGFYLRTLYQQLDQAFSNEEEFVPTRVYSDVTRIVPPQPRVHVEARLKSLGYVTQVAEGSLSFTLRAPEYPSYLLPDGHPTQDAGGKPITLIFQGDDQDAPLQSIQVDGQEVPDLYLEPELVATLGRAADPGQTQGARQIRAKLTFDEIPAMVWQAIIAVEDPRFMEHQGFDPRGIARAIWTNLRTGSMHGGSTITQQLVKNLMARRSKNFFLKANELLLSILLEIKWDKEKILERYLNEVYLGQIGSFEIHGVGEGAEHFFGKNVNDLNLGEMAFLAGVIRGPGFYSPYSARERALQRLRWVLKRMVENGYIAQAEADQAASIPPRFAPPQTSSNKAPYFTDFVKAELLRILKDRVTEADLAQRGFRVYTSLDMRLNQAAQESVANGIADLEKRLKLEAPARLEGALASVDHKTGFVRALIGGRSYSQSTFNRILNMKRQVGSTFKPIAFLAALMVGKDAQGVPYGPGYPVLDAPWKLTFDQGKQTWAPRNYEKDFKGWTSLRLALAHSINTVAARLGYEVGVERIINTARMLGIESELPAVPSISLGVAELSPVELLKAYAIFANHGVHDELTVVRGITEGDGTGYLRTSYHPQQVVDPGPADVLADMLETVFTEGTAAAAHKMGLDSPAAGKTGTTSNYRDSWFAGFTPQLTTVVWVGEDQHLSTKDGKRVILTGATAALPIWTSYMKRAVATEPPETFPVSPHIENIMIDLHTGKAASSGCPAEQSLMEKYPKGHEPTETSCESSWPEIPAETIGN